MWLWMFPVDSPQPSQFLCQLCDSTMSACLLKRHFSNRFLHCINFTIHFLHQQQIFTHRKMLLCNFFFLQPHSVISSSCKRISYVYLYVVLFSLSKSEVQDTNDSCLPGFVSWETPESNSFSKIWDKIVTIFFFTVPRITYYFPIILGILFTWGLCQVALLYHHFL